MITDTAPGSWPPEKDRDASGGDETTRPSTADTLVTLEESESDRSPINDDDFLDKGKAIDTSTAGKHGIARMPELPPEIRETYVSSSVHRSRNYVFDS